MLQNELKVSFFLPLIREDKHTHIFSLFLCFSSIFWTYFFPFTGAEEDTENTPSEYVNE